MYCTKRYKFNSLCYHYKDTGKCNKYLLRYGLCNTGFTLHAIFK